MADDTLHARLTELLEETGKRHHAAFIESDGVDPDWATWYAAYVQAHFWDAAGQVPSRSDLTFLLVGAQRAHRAAGSDVPWPSFYAAHMLTELTGN